MGNLPLSWLLLIALATSLEAAPNTRKEWPFYKPEPIEPPAVKNGDWVRNPIDAFILAKLEEKGLEPAREASRHVLVRRLYYDLIGLPPTPEEVEAFVNDTDPDAYKKVVDRLLKDQRHGARWARFWLDLARYADTAGYEGDPDLPHVWRYRDYVIDAFNNDKPYDEFVKEQVAGDEFTEIMDAGELPIPEPERLVAMTFLRLAPFTEPRGDETRHEMLSEMTSTVGSVFLGLTVGCAKCHDHKYDKIPTRDFYRMKAFFATIQIPAPERGDGFQIGGPTAAAFYRPGENEWAEAKRKELQQEAAEAAKEIAVFTERLNKLSPSRSGFGIQGIGAAPANNYVYEKKPVNDGMLHVSIVSADGGRWRVFTDGAEGELGKVSGSNVGSWYGDLPRPRHVGIGNFTAGSGNPDCCPNNAHHGHFAEVLIYDHPLDDEERQAVGAYVGTKYRQPIAGGEPQPPVDGLRFWLDASDLDADPATPNPEAGSGVGSWKDKVSGIRLSQSDGAKQPKLDRVGDKTDGPKRPAVLFSGQRLLGDASGARFLSDQQGSIVAVYTATHTVEGYGFEVGGDGAFLSTFVHPAAAGRPDLVAVMRDPNSTIFTSEERRRYEYLSGRGRFLPMHLNRLRPLATTLRHSPGPPFQPGVPTSRVMIRGEYDNPGEVVEPGFLSCITGHQKPAKIRLDPFKRWPTRSRRMALAKWIASPDNPMTARVMVNRLWNIHFGVGIVRTPSDFGQLSGGPSHRELLDWLAVRFTKEKWSLKSMHRLMVLSSVYRQSSKPHDQKAFELDPDNRLFWRFHRRRLEAEAVRDAVLAVSGRLHLEAFGLPIFPPLPDDIGERVKYSNSKWDTQYGPEGRKRSIYIYQQRTLMMPFLQTFDSLVCDESRPRRRASVTALQALALYNGDFPNKETVQFAARVRKEAGDDPRRQIERAFRLAFSREPTADETERMQAFLQEGEGAEKRLSGLCRILYNANEFVYID